MTEWCTVGFLRQYCTIKARTLSQRLGHSFSDIRPDVFVMVQNQICMSVLPVTDKNSAVKSAHMQAFKTSWLGTYIFNAVMDTIFN